MVFANDGVFIHWRYERAVVIRSRYLHGSQEIIACKSAEEALERAADHLDLIAGESRVLPPLIEFDRIYNVRKMPMRCHGEGAAIST